MWDCVWAQEQLPFFPLTYGELSYDGKHESQFQAHGLSRIDPHKDFFDFCNKHLKIEQILGGV